MMSAHTNPLVSILSLQTTKLVLFYKNMQELEIVKMQILRFAEKN